MNGLDIVLINVISYLGGILSGIYIHHKMNKSKRQNKHKDDKEKIKKKILMLLKNINHLF